MISAVFGIFTALPTLRRPLLTAPGFGPGRPRRAGRPSRAGRPGRPGRPTRLRLLLTTGFRPADHARGLLPRLTGITKPEIS